jgi:hypothetical protein
VTDEVTPAVDELRPRRRRWLRRTVTGSGLALAAMAVSMVLSPVEDDEGRSCGSSPAILLAFDDDGGRGEPGWAAACRTIAGEQLGGGLIFGTVAAAVVRAVAFVGRGAGRVRSSPPKSGGPRRRISPRGTAGCRGCAAGGHSVACSRRCCSARRCSHGV